MSTLRVSIGASWPVTRSTPKFIELPVIGCSSVTAPVNAKRPEPREALGKITEALAEEDAGEDRVGAIGADPLGARVPDGPTQPGRHQHLVQIVAIHLAFRGEAGRVEAEPLGATPIPLNPSAVDTDLEGWSQ